MNIHQGGAIGFLRVTEVVRWALQRMKAAARSEAALA